MRYRLFGYRKFSIRYDIGLKYRRYLYRHRYFNRNFDIYIEFRYDIGSISYRIYFDIDINVDIVSYRIVSKISIFISNFDLKKISHLFTRWYDFRTKHEYARTIYYTVRHGETFPQYRSQ